MRTLVLTRPVTRALALLFAASSLAGCMDGAASNPEDRQTHMGDIHAANPPATVSAPVSAPPAAPPAAAPAAPSH
jgi:hypothetical protein